MENTEYLKIHDYLILIFEQNGFITERNQNANEIDNFILYFIKTDNLKKDWVFISVQSDPDRNNLVLNFITRKRINKIEAYLDDRRRELLQDTRGENYTIQLFSGYLENIRLFPTSEIQKGIQSFLDKIKNFVIGTVLKSLTMYKTIIELDKVVNEKMDTARPLWGQVFWFHKIIICKLSGSDKYEMLFQYVMNMHIECLEQETGNDEKEYYQNCIDILLELRSELKNVQANSLSLV